MNRSERNTTFTLSGEDIDVFSEWLDEQQIDLHVERQNRLRVRLLTENILLCMREHHGEDVQISATIDTHFGTPRLKMVLADEPFNPLNNIDSEMGAWASSLGGALGLSPQYTYEGGFNTLRLRLPSPLMNPVLKIGISIAIGAIVGTVGSFLVLPDLTEMVSGVLISPAYEMWIRLLNAISAPIIFLTVITTMLNAHHIEERGGNSFVVIVRYFVLSILLVAFALVAAFPFFELVYARLEVNTEFVAGLLGGLITLIPANIVQPFAESNTQQLLLMAIVLGYLLIKIGEPVGKLKTIVRQSNQVGLQLAEWVSRLVPVAVAVFLCLELWNNRFGMLAGLWKPLVVALAISVVAIMVAIAIVAVRLKVSPIVVARKIWKPFFIALKTGSLDQSFGEAQYSCTRLLGIEQGYTKAGLPQGLVLYMPVSAIGTIVFTLFAAQVFDIPSNLYWYASAVVMAVVVFVATPPVPGANLLAYVVLFAALGIPEEALMDAMIFDVVFGIFAGAANQTMLQIEMMAQAGRFGLLDVEKLRKPLA